MAPGAIAANLVRIFGLPEFFQILADQATTLRPYFDLCILIFHA
jgi:hypothetical protein